MKEHQMSLPGRGGRGSLLWPVSCGWAVACLMAAVAHPAHAQGTEGPVQANSGSEDRVATLAEVTVTATRHSTSANDVGMSLSAISGADLERNNIVDQEQLMMSVPGLSFASKGPGQSMLSLRGVAADPAASFGSNAINGNATVGIYLDETSIALSGFNPEPNLFDMNRVEVLKGPQGTLFGSGSLSGTIRYISNAPTQQFETRIQGDASSTAHGEGNYTANAMVNIPIGDTLAFRAVAYEEDIGGYIDNVASAADVRSVNYGSPIARNVNYEHTFGGRAQLQWKPVDGFSSLLRLSYQDTHTGGVPTVDRADFINPIFATLGPFQQSRLASEALSAHMGIANLELNYDMGPATLTSETSYLNSVTSAPYEVTDVWRVFFGPSFQKYPDIPIGGTGSAVTSVVGTEQYTEELRLSSNGPGPLSYVAGLYFNSARNTVNVTEPTPGFGDTITPFANLSEALASLPFFPVSAPDLADLNNAAHFEFDRHQKQYAVFGELTYKVLDPLSLIAGGRYYHYTYTQEIPYEVGAVVAGDTSPGHISESGFNPKFSAEWRPWSDDTALGYMTASRGFRLGGFRDAVPQECGASAQGWKSDHVWNYEVGTKLKLGQVAQLNVSGYREDWSGIPTSKAFPCGFTAIENAGNARIYGSEADITVAPIRALSVTGSFAYTDAYYTNTSPDGTILSGTALPMVPKYAYGLTAAYGFPLWQGVRGELAANISYRSDQYDLSTANRDRLPGYALAGAHLAFERGPWTTTFYAENLFDKYAVIYKETSFLFENRDTIMRPRTVGVTIGFRL